MQSIMSLTDTTMIVKCNTGAPTVGDMVTTQ